MCDARKSVQLHGLRNYSGCTARRQHSPDIAEFRCSLLCCLAAWCLKGAGVGQRSADPRPRAGTWVGVWAEDFYNWKTPGASRWSWLRSAPTADHNDKKRLPTRTGPRRTQLADPPMAKSWVNALWPAPSNSFCGFVFGTCASFTTRPAFTCSLAVEALNRAKAASKPFRTSAPLAHEQPAPSSPV